MPRTGDVDYFARRVASPTSRFLWPLGAHPVRMVRLALRCVMSWPCARGVSRQLLNDRSMSAARAARGSHTHPELLTVIKYPLAATCALPWVMRYLPQSQRGVVVTPGGVLELETWGGGHLGVGVWSSKPDVVTCLWAWLDWWMLYLGYRPVGVWVVCCQGYPMANPLPPGGWLGWLWRHLGIDEAGLAACGNTGGGGFWEYARAGVFWEYEMAACGN